jgi:hypothetical protein
MRQRVLLGREVDEVIWDMIGQAITDAVDKYITKDFVAATISEWVRVNFDVVIEPEDLQGNARHQRPGALHQGQGARRGGDDITSTLGEYTGRR